jgi:hypothetical protein
MVSRLSNASFCLTKLAVWVMNSLHLCVFFVDLCNLFLLLISFDRQPNSFPYAFIHPSAFSYSHCVYLDVLLCTFTVNCQLGSTKSVALPTNIRHVGLTFYTSDIGSHQKSGYDFV